MRYLKQFHRHCLSSRCNNFFALILFVHLFPERHVDSRIFPFISDTQVDLAQTFIRIVLHAFQALSRDKKISNLIQNAR